MYGLIFQSVKLSADKSLDRRNPSKHASEGPYHLDGAIACDESKELNQGQVMEKDVESRYVVVCTGFK